MQCVRAGLGITVLPLLTAPIDMTGLEFIPLVRPRIPRTIGIITRKNQTPLPAVTAMLEEVKRSLTQYTRQRGAIVVEQPAEADKKTARRVRNR
jgi:DNA-binding transcriptional LysR family regulator